MTKRWKGIGNNLESLEWSRRSLLQTFLNTILKTFNYFHLFIWFYLVLIVDILLLVFSMSKN